MIHVEPHGRRFFAVYRDADLIAVTVYRKGARRIAEELKEAPKKKAAGRAGKRTR